MFLIGKRLGLWIGFVCTISSLFAQNMGTANINLFPIPGDTLQLSHSFLVPFSESVWDLDGQLLDTASYEISYQTGKLYFPNSASVGTYRIQYAYFLHSPLPSIRLMEIPPSQTEDSVFISPVVTLDTANTRFWETTNINKRGSLTRGITTGNNRGVSLTSGLQLQLEGDLGNGLRIEGAISDENIPIQPEGTTQQLADFDRVFIRLSKDQSSLTLGDYEVSVKDVKFAKLYRNVQGVRVAQEGKKHQVAVSGAVARGQFHTNSFLGREGVSGPYRLTGKNDERFFFILAGSERVYLNGKLMKRGTAFDYIINYNTAEITFTARHVINRASRIVVDFEYNDRNYNRSLITAFSQHSLWKDRITWSLHYARDADNPNAPFDDPEAFEQVKDSLRTLGDAGDAAFSSGVFERGFDPAQPRYARRDTLIGGIGYERYVYSSDSTQAIYQIFFTFVGPGKGMYQRDVQGVNQNVFTWIRPDEVGTPRGDYAPIRKWVLPQSRQVMDSRTTIRLAPGLSLDTETGISFQDKNRLSQLDDSDNMGLAHFSQLNWDEVNLGKDWQIQGKAGYQFVGERYQNLDRIYQAEYDRVWDIEDLTVREDERILNAELGTSFRNLVDLQGEVGIRKTESGNIGRRYVGGLNSRADKWLQGTYTFTHIDTENPLSNRQTRWQRQEGDLYKSWGKNWQTGVVLWWEDREEKYGDSLGMRSFRFWDLKPYIRTQREDLPVSIEASVNYRREEQFFEGSILPQSLAYTYTLSGTFRPSPYFSWQQSSSYRTFRVLNPAFLAQGLKDEEVFLSHIQWQYQAPNRFLRLNVVYDVNAEQISRQEVRFIEVAPGLGQYEWIDLNDNAIQEVNEFQLSTNPLVANFIKVFLPTREQVPASQLGLNSSMQWDFKPLFEKDPALPLVLIKNLRMFTQLKVNQNKIRGQGISQFFINPTGIFEDSTLLRGSSFFKHDWTFFQNHPVGDVKATYFHNRSKQFLSTGDELRSLRYWQLGGRYNLSQSLSLEGNWQKGNKSSSAEVLEGRDFDIAFTEIQPQLNYQVNRKLRLSSRYEWALRREQNSEVESPTRIQEHSMDLEGKWNFQERNTLLSELSLIAINQIGSPEFLAGYELRQGFEPGFNTRWRLMLNTFLIDNLALNVTYEGRSSEGQRVLHTARVQLRALF
ncbi:MAG: hypothetical protein AAGA10_20065 [Bacteroidota bacterium]